MIDKLIKELPRALFIAICVFCIIELINVLNGGSIQFDTNLKTTFLYTLLYSISLHLANTWLFIFLDQVFKDERFSKKRIVTGFISAFFLSLLVLFSLRIIEDVIIENKTFSDFLNQEKASNYILASGFTFIIVGIIHIIYLYKFYQENKLREQKIIATTANAQFESLKNQIDPHFLFNSLNVLSSLIEENPSNAQRFTTSLSKIYRYVLEQKDKELVAVSEELHFATLYMQLLEMRFENSISFDSTDCTNEDAKVVPLSLQLLLENCIKHNVASSSKPLHIKISIENQQLVVENNWQKKEVLSNGKGVGLQNIVNRYALLTERKVKIIHDKNSFKVYLPILTKQISIMKTTPFTEENNAYQRATKRVEALKGFYGNLISYCIVIPTLAFINYSTSSGFQWFWFPMLGWGMGLTFHAFGVFGYGKSWEERKIQEIINKDKKNNWE